MPQLSSICVKTEKFHYDRSRLEKRQILIGKGKSPDNNKNERQWKAAVAAACGALQLRRRCRRDTIQTASDAAWPAEMTCGFPGPDSYALLWVAVLVPTIDGEKIFSQLMRVWMVIRVRVTYWQKFYHRRHNLRRDDVDTRTQTADMVSSTKQAS